MSLNSNLSRTNATRACAGAALDGDAHIRER